MSAPDHAPDQVVVARISGAYGVLGWIRVVSFTEPPENILDYGPWYVAEGPGWRELSVGEIKVHGEGFIAKLRDLTSRDQAQALSGRLIAVPRDQLPALDEASEYYWRDLVGLEVFDMAGRRLWRHKLSATGGQTAVVGWDGRDRHGRELPSGVYLVRALDEKRVLGKRTLVLQR